jgi:hypothetical protein
VLGGLAHRDWCAGARDCGIAGRDVCWAGLRGGHAKWCRHLLWHLPLQPTTPGRMPRDPAKRKASKQRYDQSVAAGIATAGSAG